MKSLAHYIFLIFFLIPSVAFVHVWPMNSALLDGLAIVFAVIVFASALWLSGKDRKMDFSTFLLFPGILLVIIGVSLAWKDTSPNSAVYWAGLVIAVSVGWSIAVSSMTAGHGREGVVFILSKMALVGSLVYAVVSLLLHFGLIQEVLGLNFSDGSRLRGGFRQPNLTTTMLWLGVIAAAFLAGYGFSVKKLVLFLVVVSIPLALAASRLNYPYILIIIFLGGYLFRFGQGLQKSQGVSLLVGGGVILTSLFVVPFVSDFLAHSESVVKGENNRASTTSLVSRSMIDSPRIDEHIKIFKSFETKGVGDVFFGEGLGRYGHFSFQEPVYSGEYFKEQSAWLHSHNLYSMLLVELGLTGLIFALFVSFLMVRKLVFIRRRPEFAFLFGASALLFTHSMFEFPLWYPWFLFLLIAILTPLHQVRTLTLSSKKLMPAISFVVLIAFAGITVNLTNQAYQILAIQVQDDVDEEDYRALAVLGNDSFLGEYATLVRYRKFDPEIINFKSQLREAERMLEWRPVDLVAMRKSTLLMLDEQWTKACGMIEMMVQRYPRAAPIVLEKAVWIQGVSADRLADLAECAERGLSVWGKDLALVAADNKRRARAD